MWGLYHHKPKHHQSHHPFYRGKMIWWRILAKNVALDDVETITTIKGADLTVLNAQHPLSANAKYPSSQASMLPLTVVQGWCIPLLLMVWTTILWATNTIYLLKTPSVMQACIWTMPRFLWVNTSTKRSLRLSRLWGQADTLLDHKNPPQLSTLLATQNPIIFRATPQWFISMEQNGLRQKP